MLKRFLLLILFVFLMNGCHNELVIKEEKGLLSKVTNKKVQRIALLVGVSNYANKNADLKGIHKDIKKMETLFKHLGYKTVILYDEDSMKLVKNLNKYGKQLSLKDSFAFYYTGHGSYVKDENGDETDDNKDETLVLSDGEINKHLIDDRLEYAFAKIKARKLMIFDSCHSGTVSKSSDGKVQSKTISPKSVTSVFNDLQQLIFDEKVMDKGEYIVLSSSKNNEESLMTSNGSLFTNILYKLFTDNKFISFESLINEAMDQVFNYCKKNSCIAHTPQIESSNKDFLRFTFQDYLK